MEAPAVLFHPQLLSQFLINDESFDVQSFTSVLTASDEDTTISANARKEEEAEEDHEAGKVPKGIALSKDDENLGILTIDTPKQRTWTNTGVFCIYILLVIAICFFGCAFMCGCINTHCTGMFMNFRYGE